MRSDPRPIVVSSIPCGSLTSQFLRSLREPESPHFTAEGIRALVSAVDNSIPLAGLAICPRRISGDLSHTLVRRIERSRVPVLRLDAAVFDSIAATVDAQGVIGIHPKFWSSLPAQVGKHDLWLGLESVRSPGNLGTLMRCAEAAGATGVIVFGSADPFEISAVRASMGSVFGLRFVRTLYKEFRAWNCRYEVTVLGATGEAATDYRTVTYRRPVLIMLGDERKGLSEKQRQNCDGFIRIPMSGRPDSLNIAMAGTVLLFEARSQRHPVKRR